MQVSTGTLTYIIKNMFEYIRSKCEYLGWPLYGVVYFVTKNYLHYKQDLFVVKFWRNIISPRYLNFRHILQFTVTYAVIFFLTFSKDYQVFHLVFKLHEKIKHSNSRVHSLLLLSRSGASSFRGCRRGRVRGLGLRALLQLLGLHTFLAFKSYGSF